MSVVEPVDVGTHEANTGRLCSCDNLLLKFVFACFRKPDGMRMAPAMFFLRIFNDAGNETRG